MCQLIGLSLYFFNNFTTSHNLSCTYLVSFHPLLLPHRQSFSHQNRFLLLCSLLFTAQGPALRSFCTKKPFPCVATSPQRGISSFLCAKVKLTTPFDLCIVLKCMMEVFGASHHFRIKPSVFKDVYKRQNHLSYEPISLEWLSVLFPQPVVEMRRIELLTPCVQGRCSPS